MMNSMDKEAIVIEVTDRLRVLAGHRSVDLKSDDINELRNLIDDILSKYVDDQHLVGEDG